MNKTAPDNAFLLPALPSGTPIKSLYEEADLQAHRHKWIESEKAGHDLGDFALRDWHQRYWRRFHREHWIEHLRGQIFWKELDNGDFNLLSSHFDGRRELMDRVVDLLQQGGENLSVIEWAVSQGFAEKDVLAVLKLLDVNAARLRSSLPADRDFVVDVHRRHEPRALIVDDEDDMRVLLSDTLKDAGLSVVLARNAEEALHEMERRRFDLFMIDVMLPGRHGAEIAYYLQRHGVGAPVVAVSASPDKWQSDDLLDCGFTRILPKHFDREEILEIGRTVLKQVNCDRQAG